MHSFQFHLPTRVIFGPGALERLGDTPHLPKGGKALIVVGASGSMFRHGHLPRVQGLLASRGVASLVFDRVKSNPETAEVDEAAALARDTGADFVVGLGGGSPMDSAKAIAHVATNGGGIWDYVQSGSGGRQEGTKPPLPVVCVPTTAGTGAEVNCRAVLTRTGHPEKLAWGAEANFPVMAIVDPLLSATLPPRQTALTGMDALFHALEGFLSLKRQPVSDLLCLESIHLIATHLPRAVARGDDQRARNVMAWAATSGGMSLALAAATSLHALEHALSAARPDLPHGAGLVLLSRAYFRRLSQKAPERFPELALALGAPEDQAGAEGFLAALERLLRDIGLLDLKLSDYVQAGDIPALVDNALATNARLMDCTPGSLSREDLEDILRQALA